MPLLIIVVVVAIIVIHLKNNSSTLTKKKRVRCNDKAPRSDIKINIPKPKDEIRYCYKKKHYGIIMGKNKTVKDNKQVEQLESIFLSAQEKDGSRPNIPMKKNPDPVKEQRKQLLQRELNKGKISRNSFEKTCKDEKLNSYLIKHVRSFDTKSYSKTDLAKKYGWELDPADRKTANDLYKKSKKKEL